MVTVRATRTALIIWRNAMPIAAVLALCTFGIAIAQSAQTFGRAKKPQLSSTKRFIIRTAQIAAGDHGSGVTMVANRSKRPVRVTLSQLQSRTSSAAFSANLLLSIHDDSSNRCYWPRTAKGRCSKPGSWSSARLSRIPIAPRGKGKLWRKSEQHRFTVAWQLRPAAPNSVQGKTAQFVLQWKAA